MVAGLELTSTDPVTLFLQGLTGLGPGVVKLAGLADNNRARADDEDTVLSRRDLAI